MTLSPFGVNRFVYVIEASPPPRSQNNIKKLNYFSHRPKEKKKMFSVLSTS